MGESQKTKNIDKEPETIVVANGNTQEENDNKEDISKSESRKCKFLQKMSLYQFLYDL